LKKYIYISALQKRPAQGTSAVLIILAQFRFQCVCALEEEVLAGVLLQSAAGAGQSRGRQLPSEGGEANTAANSQ